MCWLSARGSDTISGHWPWRIIRSEKNVRAAPPENKFRLISPSNAIAERFHFVQFALARWVSVKTPVKVATTTQVSRHDDDNWSSCLTRVQVGKEKEVNERWVGNAFGWEIIEPWECFRCAISFGGHENAIKIVLELFRDLFLLDDVMEAATKIVRWIINRLRRQSQSEWLSETKQNVQ